MKLSPFLKSSTPRRAVCGVLAVWIVAAGCGDDPFAIRWSENPDSVFLYSLARPELNLVSGFNFQNRIPITVEDPTATGSWDVAVDTRDGRIVLLPPGALGIASRAGIAELEGTTFQEVEEAPQDTAAYTSSDPVQVRMGNVYVIRTNESLGGFGRRCVYYYKLEPLEIDPERGTLRFVFDGSPVCNDFRLIPPD
jgi:hypothetical protein